MLNFNRRDSETSEPSKSTLKPALYDPPATQSARTSNLTTRPASTPPNMPVNTATTTARDSSPATTQATSASPATQTVAENPGSKLFVGVNIKLKGVEISDCDVLVIEGEVEATVNSKAMEIAKPGTLKGTALIDVAEVHGDFSGELTARTRLVVHSTGRVSGTIRYGKLIVEEGGEVTGDVRRTDTRDETGAAPTLTSPAPRHVLGPSAERESH